MRYFVVKSAAGRYRTRTGLVDSMGLLVEKFKETDSVVLHAGQRRVWLKPKAKKRYRVRISQPGSTYLRLESLRELTFESKKELWAAVKAALVIEEVK